MTRPVDDPGANGKLFVAYPTFARTALTPRWIGLLIVALAAAAGFSWLGQWQVGRAVETAFVETRDTETVQPLASVLDVTSPMTDAAVDRMVRVTGRFDAGDYLVVSNRDNEGTVGYWVVGGLRIDGGGSVAVAVGWAPTETKASAAATALAAAAGSTGEVTVTGRLTAAEAVDADQTVSSPTDVNRMSIAWIVNVWPDVAPPVVQGYIVAHDSAPAGLTQISSPKPAAVSELNWLNLFYAVEWVVFSAFALFLWWRLVADDVRRQREDLGFITFDDDDDDDVEAANEGRRAGKPIGADGVDSVKVDTARRNGGILPDGSRTDDLD